MYATIDPTTALALARQHHSDVMASFPRKRRNRDVDVSTPKTVISLPTRMDVGAMSIPEPRQPHEERTVA
jgi:hypothetical protein